MVLDRRKVYDQTGSLEDSEDLAGENWDNLTAYFRSLYKEVTEDDIEGFAAGFRGSQEEAEEVLRYYARFKGDMGQVRWYRHRFRCSKSGCISHDTCRPPIRTPALAVLTCKPKPLP